MKLYNYIIKFFLKFKCFSLKKKDKRFYYLSIMISPNSINGCNIHGLWPQYDMDSYPQFCKNVQFSMKVLKPLRKDLNKYWKPKGIKDPMRFWLHEWRKHGSCIYSEITQYEYFKITLDLYKEVIDKNLMSKKYKSGNHYLIPVSLDFKLMI